MRTSATVRTAPATSGGMTFQVNFRPDPVSRDMPAARDFRAMNRMATARDTTAALSQTVSQLSTAVVLRATVAAPIATVPINTPPMPDTWVNDAERSMVSRIYRRLSIARS